MGAIAIVLAAGQGVRMKSKKPKVLHVAAGRCLIDHVLTGLVGAGFDEVRLVVGHGGDLVQSHLEKRQGPWKFFTQKKQLGTADAVKSAGIDSLRGVVIICNGDHPLISKEDYKSALEKFNHSGSDLMVITSVVKNPTGFGRILKRGVKIVGIVEEKDATPEEREIREINSGLYIAKAEVLKKLLPKIKNNNAKKEYYLTDIIALALEDNIAVEACSFSPRVCRGVNNQEQLAQASRALYRRKAVELLDAGVVIIDPTHTYIEPDVEVGVETVIHPGCMLLGKTVIGSGCVIESHCQIRDSKIGDRVEVRWGTLIDQSEVSNECLIGPYARLRPESMIGEGAHIGNFVETKKAVIGARAKANHLTYLGDVEVGEETNVGCGTITCNYAVDRKKYKTKIGKKVFIGSDTQLVAPVTIGDRAVIGSGSTITKDVPERALAVARGRQFIKPDYNKE